MSQELNLLGRILIIAGSTLILLGIILVFGQRIPFFGRLPGDIFIQRKNFTFYFPLTTCILMSFVLSIILWFISRR
jgi:hypothetical protein